MINPMMNQDVGPYFQGWLKFCLWPHIFHAVVTQSHSLQADAYRADTEAL